MSFLEIAASTLGFAAAGFFLARTLCRGMDINNSGLEGVHVSLMVALVSAGLGLLIALIMASS
jgi:hypothetical protein